MLTNLDVDTTIDFEAVRQSYQPHRFCKVCGSPFIAKRSNHFLCSHTCNQRLYLLRKAAKAKLATEALVDG
jgi:hypothetical protein